MTPSRNASPPLGPNVAPLSWFLDEPGRAASLSGRTKRLLPFVAAYALLHGVFVYAGVGLSRVADAAVTLWPAVGLLGAVLVATPRWTWPFWVTAAIAARLVVQPIVFDMIAPLAPTLLFSGINAIEALVFALLLQRPLQQSYRQDRPLYFLISLAIVALVAAVIGGGLGALSMRFVLLYDVEFWQALRLWATADYIGMILVAPIATWLLLPQIRIRRGLAGRAESAVIVLVLGATIYAALLLSPPPTSDYRQAVRVGLTTTMMLPLLWAALRVEFPVVAVLLAAVTVSVTLASIAGEGPFAFPPGDHLPVLASLQIFLGGTILFITILAFAVFERQRAREDSRLHQRFADLMVDLTGRLMAAKPATLDRTIEDCLGSMAHFAGADRCGLVQIGRDGRTISRTHAWARNGLETYPGELAVTDLRDFSWALREFREQGYVLIEDLQADLPAGAEGFELVRKSMPDTSSLLYIGLFTDDSLLGAIGFGFVRPGVRWRAEWLSVAYLVGQLFANVLKRKKIEDELQAYQDKLRLLASELSVTEERTRRKAATDLHDSVGQNLAMARMRLGQLIAGDDGHREELEQIRELVGEALRGTRYLIADLSPAILYELGLVPALQSLAEAADGEIVVSAPPGAFLGGNRPIARTTFEVDDELREKICAAFDVGDNRSFDQDPPYGVSALAEIGIKALSPGINDPETASRVIDRLVRVLSAWGNAPRDIEPKYDRVYSPPLDSEDLFAVAFSQLALYGAKDVRVGIRLQEAFRSLATLDRADCAAAARQESERALALAKQALEVEADYELLRRNVEDRKS